MNVPSCNGKNIFIRWKMECSIQRGDSRVHLSPHENILTIALINIHYLYTVGYLHGHTLGQPRTLTRQHTYRLPRLSQNWRIYHQTKTKYWSPSHKTQQRRWTYRKKYIIICKRHTKTLVKQEQELHESWLWILLATPAQAILIKIIGWGSSLGPFGPVNYSLPC
jgi:hypothetical protein